MSQIEFTRSPVKETKTTAETFYGSPHADENTSKGLGYESEVDRQAVTEQDEKETDAKYKELHKQNFAATDSILEAKAVEEQGIIMAQPNYNKVEVMNPTDEIDEDDFVKRVQTDIQDAELEYNEYELPDVKNWNEAGRIMKQFQMQNKRSTMSDSDYAMQLGNEMYIQLGGLNVTGERPSALGGIVPLAMSAVQSGDPKVINAMMYIMEMYDRKDMTTRGWLDGLKYMAGDPSSYTGIGAVMNVASKTVGGNYARRMAKKLLQEGLATKAGKMAKAGAEKTGVAKVGAAAKKFAAGSPVKTQAAVEGGFWSVKEEFGKELLKSYSGIRGDKGIMEMDLTNIAGAGIEGGIAGLAMVAIPEAVWKAGAKAINKYIREGVASEQRGEKFFKRRRGEKYTGQRKGVIAAPGGKKTPQSTSAINVDEIIASGGLKEAQAAMRNASPEDKQKLIEHMKTFNKKPKAAKAREQILVQEEFNAQFYSKLEHEVDKIPDDKMFDSVYDAENYLLKQGVKPKELEAAGIIYGSGEGEISGATLKSRVEDRPDKITKRTYDEDTQPSAMSRDDWEDSVSEDTRNSNYSDSGSATVITDENTGAEVWINERYNDEVYVDESGREYDYEDMQNDWVDNYHSGEFEDEAKTLADDADEIWDDLTDEEQRNYIIAAASDDSPWYESYSSKIEYEIHGRTFDDLDSAKDDAMDTLYENYEYQVDNGEIDGGNIYESYTVSGGQGYRLNTYMMESFDPGVKKGAREPHFGDLEYGNENVQMHTRLKERTDQDGAEGTVIEEVQSQWEQDWRKEGGTNKPLTPEEVVAIGEEMKPHRAKYTKLSDEQSELQAKANDFYTKARDYRKTFEPEIDAKYQPMLDDLTSKKALSEVEYSRAREVWKAETGPVYDEAKSKMAAELENAATLQDKIDAINEQKRNEVWNEPEFKRLTDMAKDFESEAKALEINKQEYYNRFIKPLDDKLNPPIASLANPPMQERTQYEKVAMLDELLMSVQEDKGFFGWNNSGLQNGWRVAPDDRGREGMKNAYDLEIPRIIQKATGQTPYKAYHDGRVPPIAQTESEEFAREYWDFEKAKDLAYDEDTPWYWRIDLTDELKSKLEKSKIELYGAAGVSLMALGDTEDTEEIE